MSRARQVVGLAVLAIGAAACGSAPDTLDTQENPPSATATPAATGRWLACVEAQGARVEIVGRDGPETRAVVRPPTGDDALMRWLAPASDPGWPVTLSALDDAVALADFGGARFVDAHRFAIVARSCGALPLAGRLADAWAARDDGERRREDATMLAARLAYAACAGGRACEDGLRPDLVRVASARRAARASGAIDATPPATEPACGPASAPTDVAPADLARDFEAWIVALPRPEAADEAIAWLRRLASAGLVDPDAAVAAGLLQRSKNASDANESEFGWLAIRAFAFALSDELRFEIARRQLAAGHPERARRILAGLVDRGGSIYAAFARRLLDELDAADTR